MTLRWRLVVAPHAAIEMAGFGRLRACLHDCCQEGLRVEQPTEPRHRRRLRGTPGPIRELYKSGLRTCASEISVRLT